jgi:hypothetical protein
MLLPASSPYEWQLLWEHAAAAARQHGSVRVHVRGIECVVRAGTRTPGLLCSQCEAPLDRVVFRVSWRDLCRHCARVSLTDESPAGAAASTTAWGR